MKLGVCLSGGGIRGFSHVGALKALEEHGIKPDMMSGASAGSVVAGLYSAGMSTTGIEQFVLENANFVDINYMGIVKGLYDLVMRKEFSLDGFVKGDRIENALRKRTVLTDRSGALRMGQISKPLVIIATDIDCGKTVYFSSVELDIKDDNAVQILYGVEMADAIRASIAIPGVFRPKKIETLGNTYQLVDGGIKNNLPFDVLLNAGADKVIAFNLGYNGERVKGVNDVIEVGTQAIDILMYSVVQLKKQQYGVAEYRKDTIDYESNNKQVLVLNPQIWDVNLLDSSRTQEMIDRGYNFVKESMPVIEKFLSE